MNAFNSYLRFINRLLGRRPSASPIFKTSKGEGLFRIAYQATMQLWPLPYESSWIPSRFGSTHVIVSGNPQGKPLILLHGVLAGASMWFPQVSTLGQEYRLYTIDILGDVNLSAPTYLPKNEIETAEWLAAIMDGLGIEQASVAGISLGGFLALNLALLAPQRVSCLVVIDPAASLLSYSISFMLRTIPGALSALLSKQPMDSIVKWATADQRIIDQGIPVLRQMDSALKHGRMSLKVLPRFFQDGELKQLQMPVLFVMGTKAVMYDPQAAAQRAQRLINNVMVELIPDTGHLLTLEKPESVNETILRFLTNTNG